MSSVKNDASPEGFDGASLLSALPDNLFSSRINSNDDLGSAEKMTDSAITMETNSSSDICASRAASSASVESANEMENAKSDPKEPRASAIAKIASADESYDDSFAILLRLARGLLLHLASSFRLRLASGLFLRLARGFLRPGCLILVDHLRRLIVHHITLRQCGNFFIELVNNIVRF